MDLASYKEIAENINWLAIWPELSLGVIALALLVLELLLPKNKLSLLGGVSILAQVILLGVFIAVGGGSNYAGSQFSGMIEVSATGDVFRGFFLLSSIFVSIIGAVYLGRRDLPKVEFYHIVLVMTAGLMLLAQSSNFVMLFVALETVTVGFYILVSYFRTSALSLEAGLKYLILGALSSSILLFGIVLLYGIGGNPALAGAATDPMNFSELGAFIEANSTNKIVLFGVALVIGGIAFKIGAVPFQIWIPDVYQGAPTPVTAFLAVASKAGGFAVMIMLLQGPFAALSDFLIPLLSVMAVVTILFGNLAALSQRNVKRMMGLSGIAHAGYLLVGLVAYLSGGGAFAISAIIFYLFTYLFASFAVFAVMAHIGPEEDGLQTLDQYEELLKHQPFLAGVLTIGLGSLAGIPPLAGFIGKLLLFIAAFKAGLYGLLGVSIVGVVMSIYYYFGWILKASFRKVQLLPVDMAPTAAEPNLLVAPSCANKLVMVLLSAVTILLGLYQGALSFLF